MKIAAVVNNLGPSQKSFYLIKEFNKASCTTDVSCSAFTEKSGVFVTKPLFACYSASFFTDFDGAAIATTIDEAKTLLNSSNNSKKYLYLWDLDWTEKPVNHEYYCSILRDPRLKLIARSESHAELIKNFCNVSEIAILDNWKISELLKIIGDENE